MTALKKAGKSSTRIQILLAMLAIGIVPAVFMAVQGLHCSHEAIMNVQKRELLLLLDQQTAQIRHWIQRREIEMNVLRSCPDVGAVVAAGMPPNRAIAFLNEFRKNNVHFEAIGIYDTRWKLLAGSFGTEHQGNDTLHEQLVSGLQNSNGVVWDDALHPNQKGLGIHLGIPLLDNDGKRVGYLVGALFLEKLVYSLSANSQIETSITLSLFDGVTRQWVEPPDSLAVHQYGELPEKMGRTMLMYKGDDGKDRLGVTAKLDEMNWHLVAEIDQDEAFVFLTFLLRRASITGAIVVIITLIVALLLTNKIATPYRRLMAFCQQIRDGDEQIRLEQFPSKEANEVAMSVNDMLDRLNETQRQLVQAGSLAAIGELSASIVHEMRNPLNTILMNLTALQSLVQGNDTYGELYLLAERQAKRLQTMLNELLNYGAPVELFLQEVELITLIDQISLQYINEANHKHITLSAEGVSPGRKIHVDREHFTRVLGNLVQNAILNTPVQGKVTLSVNEDCTGCRLMITDTGPGIPEEMHERIFRPFFTTRTDGTGLGLAIVKKIIDLHNGTIHVENLSGGASFIINLPCKKGEPNVTCACN